jgi:TPR repeat protein
MLAGKRAIITVAHQANGHLVPKGRGRQSQRLRRTVNEVPDKRYSNALRIMKRDGSVTRAYELLSAAAEDGDAFSKYALGTWYLHGFFVKRNLRNAIKLIREAAERNISSAAFDLAVCYELGIGIRKNIEEASRYYLRAFLFGDVEGAVELERVLYWESDLSAGRKLSKEFGRFLGTIGK